MEIGNNSKDSFSAHLFNLIVLIMILVNFRYNNKYSVLTVKNIITLTSMKRLVNIT